MEVLARLRQQSRQGDGYSSAHANLIGKAWEGLQQVGADSVGWRLCGDWKTGVNTLNRSSHLGSDTYFRHRFSPRNWLLGGHLLYRQNLWIALAEEDFLEARSHSNHDQPPDLGPRRTCWSMLAPSSPEHDLAYKILGPSQHSKHDYLRPKVAEQQYL